MASMIGGWVEMKWNDLEGGSHRLSEVLNQYQGTCKSTVTLR